LKTIHERGLLYKGHKIQWYSPGSGTVLSSHEVSLGYKEVQDPSVFVRFPMVEHDGVSLLAWTTTPWTLMSNTALAVGPHISYSQIRTQGADGAGESLILATDRLSVITEEYVVEKTWSASDLVGLRYTPPFDLYSTHDGAEASWRVVPADYVTTEDGTGIVHTSPAFGADDYATAQAQGLPVFNPVEPDGRFSSWVPLVAGLWFKEADKIIARDLRDRGLMYRHETVMHNYPHDWRKGTPLMSYPVESWFIRT